MSVGDSMGDEQYERIQLEKELQELQSELWMKEKQVFTYKEESRKKLLKDSKEIKHLENVNEDLKTDLENSTSGNHSRQDEQAVEKLQATAEEGERVELEIEQEKLKQEEISIEIKQMEKKIRQQRAASAHSGRSRVNSGKISAKAMEGRLGKANTDFSNKLKNNGKLRDEIEELRKDYSMFNGMHSKLSEEYSKTKKERDQLMDTITDIHKQREEASTRRRHLAGRNEEEQRQHELEIQDLERIITHVTNFRTFVNQKNENIDEMRSQAEDRRREIVQQKRLESAKARLREYEEAYERIKVISGEENVQVMVDKFLNMDATLYSEFTYVAELESQCGILENKVMHMKEKNATLKLISEKKDIQHGQQLKEVEERHVHMMVLNDELETQAVTTEERMTTVLARVEDLYQRVSKVNDPLLELFATKSSSHVTPKNVHLYLKELEIKIDKLVSASHYLARKAGKTEGRNVTPLQPPKTPLGFIEYCPDIKWDDDDDDGLDEAQPLTLEEIRERIQQNNNRESENQSQTLSAASSKTEQLESGEDSAPLYEY